MLNLLKMHCEKFVIFWCKIIYNGILMSMNCVKLYSTIKEVL